MKKSFALLLSVLILFSGCGAAETDTSAPSVEENESLITALESQLEAQAEEIELYKKTISSLESQLESYKIINETLEQTIEEQKTLAIVEEETADEIAEKSQAPLDTSSPEADPVPKEEVVDEEAVEEPVGQTVLVTKSGKRYHSQKCGSGNFYEATLDQAKARGLTPCQKCYG